MPAPMVTAAAGAIVAAGRIRRVASAAKHQRDRQNPAMVRVSTAAPRAIPVNALRSLSKAAQCEEDQAQLDRLLHMAVVEDRDPQCGRKEHGGRDAERVSNSPSCTRGETDHLVGEQQDGE